MTYKSAKNTSSYYQMAVQIAEAMKAGSNGNIIVTVEESQGSVQNVMEAAQRGANYARLQQIKNKYDLKNYLILNQNIVPPDIRIFVQRSEHIFDV